jgi:flagellum-specific ATP synthase
VLVDGDDMNEPITDAVRSILDGYVLLTVALAHASHYPGIDVLQSVSRLIGEVVSPPVRALHLGARDFVVKPLDAERLLGAVEKALA